MTRLWPHLRTAVVFLVAGRFFYLLGTYLLRHETGRFRVESAAAALLVVGVLSRIGTRPKTPVREDPAAPGPAFLGLFVALAFLLYWPALSIGFLSDDAVLIDRARAWDLGPLSSILFRPVPLAAWAVLGTAGAGATLFHAVNIALHGANAYLASRVATRWLTTRTDALLAGACVMVTPLGPEAVAWCAGLFDVAATSMTLVLILVARDYASASLRRRSVFVVVALVAIGCKETAIVAPVLVLLDAWVARRLNPRIIADAVGVTAVFLAYAALRLVHAFGTTAPSITRYIAQRSIFETFGGLAMPWHGDVVQVMPWVPFLGAVVVAVPLTAALVTRAESLRTIAAAAGWILIAVAPVFPVIILPADLQGSRYFYLASVGWSLLFVLIGRRMPRAALRSLWVAAAACLLLANAAAVRVELRSWHAAADVRDRVRTALRATEAPAGCAAIALAALPDNVRGAYVFRVGSAETLKNAAPVPLTGEASPACTLTWNAESGQFVR